MRISTLLVFGFLLLALTACQEEPPSQEATKQLPIGTSTAVETTPAATEATAQPPLPTPPLQEDFQGEPQLSLFPRVGDFRPPDGDERLGYWVTFIEHLTKVTGLVENPEDGNRAWSFRSINTIDSVGYFSPVAVEPNTSYVIRFKLRADLKDGATAGVGVIEFNEFLWVGEQYTEALFQKHFRGVHEGVRLTGNIDWQPQSFTFTTSPDTHMVHIVLFREGTHDRNGVLFDDFAIEAAKQ